MSLRLHGVISILQDAKKASEKAVNKVYQDFKKPNLPLGSIRTYEPIKQDDNDKLPEEHSTVQLNVLDALEQVKMDMAKYFQVESQLDYSNCEARADVKIGETVLMQQVPVTYLMFLEKQLIEIKALAELLPTLDPSVVWLDKRNQAGNWESQESSKVRTKKLPFAFIKAPATDKHPAQAEILYSDEPVGTWLERKFSGAVPATYQKEFLSRVTLLQEAVKLAREQANTKEVLKVPSANPILDYAFEGRVNEQK